MNFKQKKDLMLNMLQIQLASFSVVACVNKITAKPNPKYVTDAEIAIKSAMKKISKARSIKATNLASEELTSDLKDIFKYVAKFKKGGVETHANFIDDAEFVLNERGQ